ncbi:MAG TPA: type III pantothenate kinase [Candidatus Kapabacteria bacterium]|nr:type III pantothenate kinase [Candidatus Kapabacteria bacterium]
MLLTIDIGNTATGVAIFDGDVIASKNKLLTPDEISVTFLKSLVKKELRRPIRDVIVSSVVPFVDESLKEAVKEYFHKEAIFIDCTTDSGLIFKIDRPSELGADRIADAVGAMHFFEPPFIIIDSGTAITFDVISKDREYLGGSIMPGIELSIHSLAEKTAKLERIHFSIPKSILSTNTQDHIRAGIFFSCVGGLTYMIKEYKKIIGEKAKVIATGGLSKYFEGRIEGIDRFEPNLIYYGLKKIYDRIKK